MGTYLGMQRQRRVRWLSAVAGCLVAQVVACEHGDIVVGRGGSPVAAPEVSDAGVMQSAQPAIPAADSGALPPVSRATGGMVPHNTPAQAAALDAEVVTPVSPTARGSAGCSKDVQHSDTGVLVSGTRAEYLVDIPTGYNSARPYPLVLAFRGTNTSADAFRAELDLAAVTAEDAFRVHANPVGNAPVWDFQRDIALVDALLAEVSLAYCVDLDRVFALGDGAGALFVNLIGCVLADKVRGIALLASAPPPPFPCTYNTAVWLIQQFDAEPMLVGAGLGNRDFWTAHNGCQPNMSVPLESVPCSDYTGCAAQFPVRYCEHGGDALPAFAVAGAWAFLSAL